MGSKRPWEALDLLVIRSGCIRVLVIQLILISLVGARTQSPRDVKVEKLLKKLNKPPIKTLQSPDGEIIDCVDIYKQPAFDHPLMKNHTIEMRPRFDPGMVDRSNYSSEYADPIWRQNGSCPEGAIPIRRVRKSDLLRTESLESFGMVHPNPYTPRISRIEVAGARMLGDIQFYYNGVKGDLSVWKPWVERGEATTSSIGITSGKNSIHSIRVGWAVMPRVLGDDQPRTIIAWMGRIGNTVRGCYNLLCPGFVQTSRSVVLGSPLPISRNGSPLSILRLQIHKSSDNKWWVKMNGMDVGYFSPTLFPYFKKPRILDWTGDIVNKMNFGHHAITQMGSGRFAEEGYGRAAHFENMMYIDHLRNVKPAQNPLIEVSFPRCYNAILYHPPSATSGPALFYGGPGGMHCDRTQRG